MTLNEEMLRRIKDMAAEMEYGSIEIRLDSNNRYVDIIKQERIRVKGYAPNYNKSVKRI
jgi:hypothetical protein